MLLAPSVAGSQLAFIQLRGRLRSALRRFRKITGMTAVASLAPTLAAPGSSITLLPPIHPVCARRLRSVRRSPCSEQWLHHLRATGSFTVLVDADCIGRDLTATMLSGALLGESPPPGEVFFYLAEYLKGSHSGYGTERSGREMVVVNGDPCR